MDRKVSFIPEGYHTVMPSLTVRGAAEAIEFYKRAFGAVELMRFLDPKGRIMHAEFKIGNSIVGLGDEMENGARSSQALGGSPVSFFLYVEDVDASFQKALSAGAVQLKPVADQFYGDRVGILADPYGLTWSLATHVEDVSVEEMNRRFANLQAAGVS